MVLSDMWLSLEPLGFHGYEISNWGQVRNTLSGDLLSTSANQSGTVYVGLTPPEGGQVKRSVASLVAKMFLDEEVGPNDNIIHLNGDRSLNAVTNLAVRPGWFAKQYHRQFESAHPRILAPIREFFTDEWFANSWAACMKYGLLDKDVLLSVVDATTVWPTGQMFVFAETP